MCVSKRNIIGLATDYNHGIPTNVTSKKLCDELVFVIMRQRTQLTPWRNGSASDSRSEGCVFKSRRGQGNLFLFLSVTFTFVLPISSNWGETAFRLNYFVCAL